MKKQVGLLGGTFDPVHNGHLQLADAAIRKLKLDKVLFIPAAIPPHKPDWTITSYSHRAKMIELALTGRAGMEISTIEQSLPTPSYTIDTLATLEKAKKNEDYYFITGLDAFLEIDTWKSYKKLLYGVNFIVVARSGYDHTFLARFLQNLGYIKDKKSWRTPRSGKCLLFLEEEIIDIPSSRIRALIQRNKDIKPFLPESVVRYIGENGLYRF